MATDLNSQHALDDSPAVWIGTWGSYNEGILHGRWVDLEGMDADDIQEAIDEVLKSSPIPNDEEWAFFDNSGFYGVDVSENPDLDELATLVELLAEHGAAYGAFAEMEGGAEHATEERFTDAYRGEWESERAYGEELFDECYLEQVPEAVRMWIDYESFTHDLFIDSCYSTRNPSGGVFVFDRL